MGAIFIYFYFAIQFKNLNVDLAPFTIIINSIVNDDDDDDDDIDTFHIHSFICLQAAYFFFSRKKS